MKFEFIGNACGIFHGAKGTKILCDPWIVDGVFEGSWFHYPPLTTTMDDLQGVDGIYLSHIHPDHYDERHFEFRREIPIFILEEQYRFLEKRLRAKGYYNLAVIPSGHTHSFNEFRMTLFSPFTRHPFHAADIGNIIDSAMVIQDDDGTSAFNANDNTPTPEACTMLRDRFGTIDLAMINYNSAGPYPACFKMTDRQKTAEHKRLLERNFNYMVELLANLRPKYILPFAGAYVLGGKLSKKNRFIGTTTWDDCIANIDGRLPAGTVPLALREHGIIDLATNQMNKPYEPINITHMERYIVDIAKIRYPYQSDLIPPQDKLFCDVLKASANMRWKMELLGIKSDTIVTVKFGHQEMNVTRGVVKKSLTCSLSPKLMRRILDRKANWNNAEIGCHIEFTRSGEYEPDLHTALQFLHL